MRKTIAVVALALTLAACGSAPAGSARDVAQTLQAARFTDCGPHPLAGITDSGIASLHGTWFWIDTFSSPRDKTAWLAAGLTDTPPFAAGQTWIAYSASYHQHPGC